MNVIKLTSHEGPSLNDRTRLFDSGLDGRVTRSIDVREGETINENTLEDLIRKAAPANVGN